MNYKSLVLILLLTTGSAKPETENLQLDMLSTILQTPSILAMDSTNPDDIFLAACFKSMAHAIKIGNLYHLLKNEKNESLVALHALKSIIHIYACTKVVRPELCDREQAIVNKQFVDKLRRCKIDQLFLLIMEIGLRGASIYQHNPEKIRASRILTGFADVLEFVRMFTEKPILQRTDNTETVVTNTTPSTEPVIESEK